MSLGKHNPEPARASGSPAVPSRCPPEGVGCILGRSSCSSPLSPPQGRSPSTSQHLPQALESYLLRGLGSPIAHPPQGEGLWGWRGEPRAGGEGDKQARGLIAVIITIIMAFIWLPNESDHRQREKLSIAQALMNFFANCNQARPSQLAD